LSTGSEPVNAFKAPHNVRFTRLHAQIAEEDGGFTVRVRMVNHLNQDESASGEQIAATFDIASSMIESLASDFAIPQQAITIKIVMRRFSDGTIH